jgi:hypothetical protein
MKHLLFLSLPLLLFLISCSENETGPITYTDTELKEKIVGTWSTDYVTITFDAKGNFTEYIEVNYTNGDTISNEIDDIKGTYDIVDGILRYTNITEWAQNEHIFGGGHILPDYKITIARNYLYLYSFDRLIRIGDDTDSIWGDWYSYAWTHKYDDPEIFGIYEQTYDFSKDSMTATIGSRISFDTSQTFYNYTQPLTYNPPEISYSQATWITEFHGGQLWMFFKRSKPPTPFVKQK